jgi:hypothetical protein
MTYVPAPAARKRRPFSPGGSLQSHLKGTLETV